MKDYKESTWQPVNGSRKRLNPSLKNAFANIAITLFLLLLIAFSVYELGRTGGAIDTTFGITAEESKSE